MISTSARPQILSVLSGGIHSPYVQYQSDPDLKTNFSISNAANAAGFYNDIALDSLNNQYPNVNFFHSAPGAVKTNWGSGFPWYLKGPVRFLQLFLTSIEDCAEYQCSALFNNNFNGGFYPINSSGFQYFLI